MAKNSSISGVSEIDKVLKAMPEKLAERILVSGARAGANVIRKSIVDRAPRSGLGADARSRRSSSGKDYGPLHKNIRVTRRKITDVSVEFAIHTGQAFWALFLEFGTVKMSARPFFTPAVDTSVQPAVARTGKVLGDRITKQAKELSGKFGSIKKGTRRRI